MTALHVLACAPGASVQDAGRPGHRRFGVACAGAMDLAALALANALVGNAPGEAALELPLAGARLGVAGGPVLVAVGGPGVAMEISGRRIPDRRSARAAPGETIAVLPPRGGAYGYLAVAGGLRTEPVLGSRAFHRRSGIGGPPPAPGASLPVDPGGARRPPRQFIGALPALAGPMRCLPGPQLALFTEDARQRFQGEPFRLRPQSDRMGLRLDGPGLAATAHDILSDGVVPGCVQVPGDGQPIVLMRDCQTTGGYPKIATVISADLDRLAQIPPGDSVRFRFVTMAEARTAARSRAAWIAELPQRMASVADPERVLYTSNLIGGVTTGEDGEC